MNKFYHTQKLFVVTLCLLVPSMVLQADPIPSDSKILVIGTAADTHKTALKGLIAGDATANALNITVESFETTDVLNAYFTASDGSLRHPSSINPLQAKLDEGWDAILVNPCDLNIRVGPEMGMEGIRLIKQYLRGTGTEIFVLVPTFDPTFNGDYGYKSTATDVKERAYRIADALEISAIPVGICWQTVLADGAITATDTTLAAPNTHAVNTYITTIFSELFEASSATSTFRHGGISGAEFALIAGHAHQAWQDALTATHYTGDYVGIFSPMPDAIDAANKHTGWTGASTETMTRNEWHRIYQRQGVAALPGDTKKGVDFSRDYDFAVKRGTLPDVYVDSWRSQDPGNDLRVFGLTYKDGNLTKMVGWGLSRRHDYEDWFYPSRMSPAFGVHKPNYAPYPYKRFVPNMPGFVRYWTDYPNVRATRYQDSHLNENLIMMQSSMIYTMASAGANPLENVTNLEAWTGPQRYAAGLGYAMIMGIGRLQKLEMAPVATGLPRYEMQRNSANPLTLPGIDFNGLPLTAEIVTPPANGTLTPSGGGFIYTPDTDFDGVDTVTYRVNNGTDTSLPLTIYLPVEPYVHAAPSGTVFFEDDFDDQNINDWSVTLSLGGKIFFSSASNNNYSWTDGFTQPYDGVAGLSIAGRWGNAVRTIDTTGFENLTLTIRVGGGYQRDRSGSDDRAWVHWYDGSTWRRLISHKYPYNTMRLFKTYEVVLPPEAANNPSFRLRLAVNGGEGYFDSIRLSGDVILTPPVATDLHFEVAMEVPKAITLVASDINIFDTLSYSYSQPPHGTLTGTAPDLTYTSDAGYTGPDSFTYTANDGTQDSNIATVTFNVRNNTPPAFTSDPVVQSNATEEVAYSGSIADNVSDPDSDPLTFSKVSGPAWLSVAANGDLSGTPFDSSDVGLNSFTVKVDDGIYTDSATLEITVINVSYAPITPVAVVNVASKRAPGTKTTSLSFDAGVADKLVVTLSSENSWDGTPVITYNGEALTQALSGGGRVLGVWYLDNPYTGGAATLSVDCSSITTVNGLGVGVVSLANTEDGYSVSAQSADKSVTVSNVIADSIVIAAYGVNATHAASASAPLTGIYGGDIGSAAGAAGYALASTKGSHTYSFTSSGVDPYTVAVAFPPVRSVVATVTYDGNGSDAGTAPIDANSPYTPGAPVTVLANTDLVRASYTFAGWNTEALGGGTSYAADDTFTATADTTLYAQWTPGPNTPPSAPTGLGTTPGNGSVSLGWDDNSEGDMGTYSVYRSTTSSNYSNALATGLSSSDYVDNTVSNGTTYYYVVTATDTNSNESAQSSQVSATPTDGQSLMYYDVGQTSGGAANVAVGSTDGTFPGETSLISFTDGSATGVKVAISSTDSGSTVDMRSAGETAAPTGGDAYALFNDIAANLNMGTIGVKSTAHSLTFTLTGLNENREYDLALYGNRTEFADGADRFTLGGATSATNGSSVGIQSTFVTEMDTRDNYSNVARWKKIVAGADGEITVTVTPTENASDQNIVYINALRLEVSTVGYEAWATENGFGAATEDDDGDGISNLLEYAFGATSTVEPTLPVFSKSGSGFTYVYPELAASDAGITYTVQYTTNLVSGTWTDLPQGSVEVGDPLNTVTVNVDTEQDKKFIRVKVEQQ